jgi:Immunity protein 27
MIELTETWARRNDQIVVDGHAARINELLAGPLVELFREVSGWRIVYRHRTTGSFWELDHPQSELPGGGPRRLRELDALPYPAAIDQNTQFIGLAPTNELTTCEHLWPIEVAARSAGMRIVTIGQWWDRNSTKSIYFDCVLNRAAIVTSFALPAFVVWRDYDGRAAGHEAGLCCERCDSLLVGKFGLYGGQQWPDAALTKQRGRP